MKIALPIQAAFAPLEDITAFELAKLLPYFHGRPMLQAEWDALGTMQRHFIRIQAAVE